MCGALYFAQNQDMSTAVELSGLSKQVADLVNNASRGVVAVKSAAYKVASGVILRDGLVAVANHSLRREDRIPVRLPDGSETGGTILGRHPGFDIAFLKVEGLPANPLPTRDPTELRPGILVAVVGLTIDVGISASLGILGAVSGQRRTWRGGTLDHFLRLDVNLYPSQSGAAVVDATGALIGMATPALLRYSAVAVPVTTLDRVAEELLTQGRIRQGYLGIGVQPVAIPPDLRDKLGLSTESGLIVLSVESDSPAAQANLQLGDILLSLDRQNMTDVDDLQTALHSGKVGSSVSASILRGGAGVTVQLTVGERIRKGK